MAQQSSPAAIVSEIVDRLISSRRMSHREYHQLCSLILSDNQIDEEERLQINRLFDAIQSGQLRVMS
ncbi:MAG: hypothetical protein WCA35_22690 [Kovacikia sp.]